VRGFLKPCETSAIWLLFFAPSVYGHAAHAALGWDAPVCGAIKP
jgi:hypothetical protein